MVVESFSADETFLLGEEIGRKARPGDVYVLDGDIGCGKTVIAKGIASGLGVADVVNSPTFTILKIYKSGRLNLHHFDVYRIEDPEEMEEIGYNDFFYGTGVSLIEWGERIAGILPESCVRVCIEKVPEKGDEYRRITIEEPRGVQIPQQDSRASLKKLTGNPRKAKCDEDIGD